MGARMRHYGWAYGCGLLGLALLTLAGCQHNNGSGCSSGCCRNQSQAELAPPKPGAEATALPAATNPPAATATAAQSPYGGQKTCPVTGEALGSMGPAVPVTVQGETVYVCCPGCAAKIKRDPDGYLAKVRAERAGS